MHLSSMQVFLHLVIRSMCTARLSATFVFRYITCEMAEPAGWTAFLFHGPCLRTSRDETPKVIDAVADAFALGGFEDFAAEL